MNRFFTIFAAVLLCVYALAVAAPPIWDTDVWWHLRVGEWIVENARLPTTDFLSAVEPERPWRTFSWLFEILVYGVNRAVGLTGLRVLTALVVVAAYALFARAFWRTTRSAPATFALTMLLVLLFDDRIRARPHIFNFLGEALLLPFLAAGGRLDSVRSRVAFGSLFVLWANLHNPGSLFGVIAVGFHAVMRVALTPIARESPGAALRSALWPVVLAALAVVVTPYGPALILDAKENIAPVHGAIGEWQPVLAYVERGGSAHHFVAGLLPYAVLFASSALVIVRLLRKRLTVVDGGTWVLRAAPAIFALGLSLVAMRFVYLSVFAAAWVVSAFAARGAHWLRWGGIVVAVAATAASIGYSVDGESHGGLSGFLRRIGDDVERGRYPESAAAVIREAPLSGTVFSPTAWGGYLLWYARPPRGVAVDARYNLSPRVFAALRVIEDATERDGARIIEGLNALAASIAVLPRGAFPFDEWPRATWMRIAHDRVSETFLRRGSADSAAIQAFLGVASEDAVERAAATRFGERLWDDARAEWRRLEAQSDHASVHQLSELERIAGRNAHALSRLRGHIQAMPNCVVAATAAARILHGQGDASSAYRLLRIAEGVPNLPPETTRWIEHLRGHARTP